MANPEHLETLKHGVEQWNKWRDDQPDVYPDLRVASLSGANLRGADSCWVNLRGANLGQADLTGAQFCGADLEGANLRQALLPNADLGRANAGAASLEAANLTGANLRGANLREASLIGTVLHRANLSGASVAEVDVGDPELRSPTLSEINLRREDRRIASLRGESLGGTNLRGASLKNADLTGSWAGATSFADLDLSSVKGLETIYHLDRSTIGIDTVYKSQGKIPEVFLRGCGVPDEFIAYVGSLGGRPIEFYSCFISYSTKDQNFAERLYNDLQSNGVRCWFAPEEMKGGRKLHEQIDEAIRLHDKLLLILSEHSMNSTWVETEILKARKGEIEGNREKSPPKQSGFHPNERKPGSRWGPRLGWGTPAEEEADAVSHHASTVRGG